MSLITIASTARTDPERIEREVPGNEQPSFIRYNGVVYQMRWGELRNLGLDSYGDVERVARDLGDNNIGEIGLFCPDCNFNSEGVVSVFAGERERIGLNCTYGGKKGVKIAMPRDDGSYMQPGPCVLTDALVSYLADKGFLDSFIVNQDFDALGL